MRLRIIGVSVFSVHFSAFSVLNLFGFGIQLVYLALLLLCVFTLFNVRLPKELSKLVDKSVFFSLGLFLFFVFQIILNEHGNIVLMGETPFSKSIKQLFYYLISLSMFYGVVLFVRTEEECQKLYECYLLGAKVSMLVGYVFYALSLLGFNSFAFLANNVSVPTGLYHEYAGFPRFCALSGEPAMYGMLQIPLFYDTLSKILRGSYRNFFSLVSLFSASALSILLTFSLSSIVLACIVTIYLVYLTNRKNFFKLILLLPSSIIVVFLLIYSTPIWDRFLDTFGGESYSSNIRIMMAESSLMMFFDNYLFGVGLGMFGFYVEEYIALPYENLWEPMSLFFRLLSELGIVGTFFYAAIFLPHFFKRNRFSSLLYHDISICVFLTILFHFFSIPSLGWMNLWFMLGLLVSLKRIAKYEGRFFVHRSR